MEILVVYDIATVSQDGQRRLRKVAQLCQAYGQRVQKSVFECIVNDGQAEQLRHQLLGVMDQAEDSLRIYRLREPRARFTFVAGQRPRFDLRDPLVV